MGDKVRRYEVVVKLVNDDVEQKNDVAYDTNSAENRKNEGQRGSRLGAVRHVRVLFFDLRGVDVEQVHDDDDAGRGKKRAAAACPRAV